MGAAAEISMRDVTDERDQAGLLPDPAPPAAALAPAPAPVAVPPADLLSGPADLSAVPPADLPPDPAADPAAGEVCLPSRPESAAVARRLTRRQLGSRWLLPQEQTEDAVLLVSELVGNAVRHAGAPAFGLRLRRRRGWVRVEVRDPSRALPCHLPVEGMDVLSGRGLFLVDTLADRWGVDLLPQGKVTWFEMRVAGR